MGFWDWLIVILPVVFVLYMGMYSRRYIRGVADFLSAGRICGRYVICVGDVANALSIIGLVAYVEVHYKTGFALTFWNSIIAPLSIIMSLAGYCSYRFRETKAMSLGQFLEMRYNRKFRIFASALRSLSEMLANMIMPAIAARFFIYFLGLPHHFNFFGFEVQTFMLIVIVVLVVAISIICMGGTLALVVTDAIQGMILYPLLVIFVIFILSKYSWNREIVQVMMDRAPGESFINPFDLSKLRDFNLFALVVTIMGTILHRASWIGAGTSSAAKSAHEQKMAGLLGGWRNSLGMVFYVLIAISIIGVMNHRNYASDGKEIRDALVTKIAGELVPDQEARTLMLDRVTAIPPQVHVIGTDAPLSEKANLDTPVLNIVHETLKETDKEKGNAVFQQFRTLYYQMMMGMTMRDILPPGLLGLFCLLLVLAMISTDDTRIYSASLTVAQDVILPLRKKPFTPNQHIWLLRWTSIGVGVFFFCGSFFMSQLDYINLFVTLMTTMWMGGCGPVMIFGLYSRFGTTAGAFTSLITGMLMSFGGILLQRNWAATIYPWLEKKEMVESVGAFLTTLSKPLNPYIVWEMNPVKFPINSYEIYFLTMLTTLFLYCAVSWFTSKEPFNLERMLHRGKYRTEGDMEPPKVAWGLRNIFTKLIGITPQYSRGDRLIARGFFIYSFGYSFVGMFLVVAIWNSFSPWPLAWWGKYYFVSLLGIPAIIALFTTFWFGIGGAIDLFKLFRDLEKRTVNHLDDGRVEGHTSLADKDMFEKLEKGQAQEPTPEEQSRK